MLGTPGGYGRLQALPDPDGRHLILVSDDDLGSVNVSRQPFNPDAWHTRWQPLGGPVHTHAACAAVTTTGELLVGVHALDGRLTMRRLHFDASGDVQPDTWVPAPGA
jgi:hypothetical protein